MKFRNLFSLVLSFMFVFPFAAQAETFTLSFQLISPPNAPVSIAVEKWTKEIEAKSNGQLKFDLVYSSGITRMEGAYSGLKKGAVDISNFSPNQAVTELPRATTVALPFLVDNAIEGSKVLWGLYDTNPEFQKEFEDVVLLGMFTSDRNIIGGSKTPIKSPADIKNKRMAVGGAGVIAEEVRALGAEPIPVVAADTYVALQRGMGDFFYGQIGAVRSLKLQEVLKYITVFSYSATPQYVAMNKDVWNTLPSELQDLLLTFKDFSKELSVFLYEDGLNDLEILKNEGVEITILEGAQFEAFETLAKSSTRLTDFWKDRLASGKIADPEALMAEVYSFAEKMKN